MKTGWSGDISDVIAIKTRKRGHKTKHPLSSLLTLACTFPKRTHLQAALYYNQHEVLNYSNGKNNKDISGDRKLELSIREGLFMKLPGKKKYEESVCTVHPVNR